MPQIIDNITSWLAINFWQDFSLKGVTGKPVRSSMIRNQGTNSRSYKVQNTESLPSTCIQSSLTGIGAIVLRLGMKIPD